MEGSTGAKLNPDYSATNSSLQRDRETLATTPRDRTTGAASRVPRLSALALNWARHAARAACGRGARRDRSTRPRPCHIPHARAPRRGGCERARGLFGAGAWRDAYRTMDMGTRNSHRRRRRCSVRGACGGRWMRTIRGRERRVAFAYPAYRDSGVGARVSCVLFVYRAGSDLRP